MRSAGAAGSGKNSAVRRCQHQARATVLLGVFCTVLLASLAAEAGTWSRWQQNECYAAIEYRVRHVRGAGGDRQQWTVDIRNRLRQPVYFNWALTEQLTGHVRLNNQMSLRAGGQLRRNAITGAGPGVPVRLLVGHFRVGTQDAPEQPCDRKRRDSR